MSAARLRLLKAFPLRPAKFQKLAHNKSGRNFYCARQKMTHERSTT